jgi:signal peptidase II
MARRRMGFILPIIALCIALDQGTKALAQALLPPGTLVLLGDLVRLQLSENVGAFLSLGATLSPELRFLIFTVASAVLVIAVIVYAILEPELPHDVVIALACVSGGGLSNLFDRATRDGRVVDFLNFGIGPLRTGILNVADIFITFGALYVVWAGIRAERHREPLEHDQGEGVADDTNGR